MPALLQVLEAAQLTPLCKRLMCLFPEVVLLPPWNQTTPLNTLREPAVLAPPHNGAFLKLLQATVQAARQAPPSTSAIRPFLPVAGHSAMKIILRPPWDLIMTHLSMMAPLLMVWGTFVWTTQTKFIVTRRMYIIWTARPDRKRRAERSGSYLPLPLRRLPRHPLPAPPTTTVAAHSSPTSITSSCARALLPPPLHRRLRCNGPIRPPLGRRLRRPKHRSPRDRAAGSR